MNKIKRKSHQSLLQAAGHGQTIIKIINNTGSERHMTQWMYIYIHLFCGCRRNKNKMLIKIHCFSMLPSTPSAHEMGIFCEKI